MKLELKRLLLRQKEDEKDENETPQEDKDSNTKDPSDEISKEDKKNKKIKNREEKIAVLKENACQEKRNIKINMMVAFKNLLSF